MKFVKIKKNFYTTSGYSYSDFKEFNVKKNAEYIPVMILPETPLKFKMQHNKLGINNLSVAINEFFSLDNMNIKSNRVYKFFIDKKVDINSTIYFNYGMLFREKVLLCLVVKRDFYDKDIETKNLSREIYPSNSLKLLLDLDFLTLSEKTISCFIPYFLELKERGIDIQYVNSINEILFENHSLDLSVLSDIDTAKSYIESSFNG